MSQDTGPARLPGLPVLKTTDQALARWAQAVAEHLEVRAGARGHPLDRAATQRDLKNAGMTREGLSQAIGAPASLLVRGTDGSVGSLSVSAFVESIRNTALYQDLLRKLDDPGRFDAQPDEIRAMLLKRLDEEAQLRGADVRRLDGKLQSVSNSLAYSVQEVTAAVEGSLAGVREVAFASASASQAQAGRVTQLVASLDGTGSSTIEESLVVIADRTAGLSAQAMLKLNAGGAMAGIGLMATEDPDGTTESVVLIQASKFALVGDADVIADPMNPPLNRVPFGYDSATNTLYLNGQVRINSGGVSLADAASTAGLTIAASSLQWRVDATGAATNPAITLTAQLRSPLTGMVTWSASGASTAPPPAGTSNTWVVFAAAQVDDSVTYTATLAVGDITYSNTVTLTRLRDGLEGDMGGTGPMGSLTGYGPQYGISSTGWSDTVASRVIYNMLTGETGTTPLAAADHLVLGDTVTLSNGSTFAATRYWSGSSWLTPGVVIDGNLLVNGTVSATKITAGSISTSGGNANINIGSTSFIGSITSPLHVSKTTANESQALITAANNKDASVAIWGSSTFGTGNGVSGTWHASDADTSAGRWQMLGVLGSGFLGAAVAGNTYGGTMEAGAFRRYSGSSNLVPGTITNQTRLAGASWAIEATGPVRLESTASPLLVNGSAGASGQVLTSGGAGVTPTWTTVSGGGGSITYSGLQAITSGTTGSALGLTATLQVTGLTAPATGAGLELAYGAGVGYVNSYSRTGGVYMPLSIGGSTVDFPNSTAISMAVAPTFPTPAPATNSTAAATTAFVKAQSYTSNTGTVTSFSFTTGNGISGSVSTATTTPALALTLGAVTGTSFNGMTGFSTVTGSAPGTASAGTGTIAARNNHVHPLQTTVSGSSGSCTGNAASATTVGGYKCFGGSGAGGTAVTFPSAFTGASSSFGVSVTPIDGYVVGISAVSGTGFTAITRTIAGAVSSQAFRWTAIGLA